MDSPNRINLTHEISLDENELEFRYMRASGPGGQNVNKLDSAAQLRFDVAHSPSLPDYVRIQLLQLAHNRITDDGILVIEAKRFRTQEQNRKDALDRLINLIRRAAEPPKIRKKTRPTKAAIRRRLEEKRRRGEIKLLRSAKPDLRE